KGFLNPPGEQAQLAACHLWTWRLEEARMPLDLERKKTVIEQFRTHEGDTGSPEVQIALITERVNSLTEHFKQHASDDRQASRSPRVPEEEGSRALPHRDGEAG